METQLITVVALLLLAVVGLSVGVANDAVNFLNSSIGSKVASFKVIMIIAALGMITGVTFSSGMMEVARKGIFNPEYFVLDELLIIFFAVMIQNILLLDLFNTYGLPTSTTVSVVFGLFGGALAVSFLKISHGGESFDMIFTYINVKTVITIVAAIFLSVVAAFIAGSVVQYLSRLLFTFDFAKRINRYGSIWGGIALTIITYFIIIKGAKGASFMTYETVDWIKGHTLDVVLYSFLSWAVILQLLTLFFKVNILRIIVIVGTFSLAMAFAANDLVNFIGAPLAGLNAYQIATGFEDPLNTTMEALSKPFKANTLILLASGLVMVLTLYFSKKALTVSKTEIDLGRQDEGFERFESYMTSRLIVRMTITIIDFFNKIIPDKIRHKLSSRFDLSNYKPPLDENGEPPSFDLLRAAVNLVVASALISYGTSMKLPLSTTYVTFIVAMATALPDRAWGRDSAVYRVSGVLTVVGGWFFTAFMATLAAMIIAVIVYYLGFISVLGFIALSAYLIYRSSVIHKKREIDSDEKQEQFLDKKSTPEQTIEYAFDKVGKYFKTILNTMNTSYQGLYDEDLKQLNKARKQAKKIHHNSDILIGDVLKAIRIFGDEEFESGHIYAKALGALHEMSSRLLQITKQNYDYYDNNHYPFHKLQIDELKKVNKKYKDIFKEASQIIAKKDFKRIKDLSKSANEFNTIIRGYNKNQIKRLKKTASNKRRSMLFLNLLDSTQGIVYNTLRVSMAIKEFYKYKNNISQ